MDLKTKITRSTILSETQKVLLLAKLDKIPESQAKNLAVLLDQDEEIQREGFLAMKTLDIKTRKQLADRAEQHA